MIGGLGPSLDFNVIEKFCEDCPSSGGLMDQRRIERRRYLALESYIYGPFTILEAASKMELRLV
jgi:hypothetical protein